MSHFLFLLDWKRVEGNYGCQLLVCYFTSLCLHYNVETLALLQSAGSFLANKCIRTYFSSISSFIDSHRSCTLGPGLPESCRLIGTWPYRPAIQFHEWYRG